MMMKRSLFILLLLCSCLLSATRAAAQRGLPGQVGIQVGAGVADGFLVRRSGGEYTFGAEVAVTRNNANRTFWKFAAGYLRRDYRYLRQLVPQEQYTAQAGYFLQLLHDRRYNLSLAVGAEALIGYETVNRGRRTLEDGATLRNRDAFLYGGAIAAEVSVYFSDRTIFLLSVQQRALAGSTLATFHTFLSLGVRFIIN